VKNTSTITVEITELRGKEGDETVKELAELLESKVNAKVDVTSGGIILNYEEKKKPASKAYVRVLLRKFLHQAELKDRFRVIAGKENALIIKERKPREEEE